MTYHLLMEKGGVTLGPSCLCFRAWEPDDRATEYYIQADCVWCLREAIRRMIAEAENFAEIHSRLMALRADMLTLKGHDLETAHGLLIGVMVAVERIRGRNECGDDHCGEVFAQTDALIAELRESTGPL